jgi:two-component system NtrC family sensor kinase
VAESFRDQALIAIVNARLFNETKEAPKQQTATSEVLRLISNARGDLEPEQQTATSEVLRVI